MKLSANARRWRIWRTLGLRLMVFSLVVEVLMLSVLMVSNAGIMEQAISQQFDTRLAELRNLVEASLGPPLVQHDYGMLQDALDALRSAHGIDYLVLMDHRGRVMAASGWTEGDALPPLSAGAASESGDRYDTRVEIRLGGQVYGDLRLGVSTTIFTRSRHTLLASSLIIATFEVILSAAVLLGVGFWLTRRLALMTKASEAIARGDLRARVIVGESGNDEISRLAGSFNSMAATLELRLDQIAGSEQRYRILFDGSPVALLEYDIPILPEVRALLAESAPYDAAAWGALMSRIRIKAVNAAAVRLFEAGDAESLMRHLATLATVPGLAGADLAAFAGGEPRTESEGTLLTLAGRVRTIAFSRSVPPVDGRGGDILLVSLVDVTEARLAEHTLSERTAALERSNAELEQFAYVASHDLREPLRTVSNFLSLLERRCSDKLDKDGKEFLDFAREGAVRMDRLVLDLLDFSRVGRIDTLMELHDSRALAERALKVLQPALEDAGAQITLSGEFPIVYTNDSEMVRLLVNLVGNAVKFRDSGRPLRVEVSCERRGGFWQFAVADNGIGIEEQYFDKVFRIFQRLHPREVYEGTGIGLAVCKRIVERHGGRIWLTSRPGEGSTFYFTIPVQPA